MSTARGTLADESAGPARAVRDRKQMTLGSHEGAATPRYRAGRLEGLSLARPAQKRRARGAKPTHRQPEAATAPPAINQTKAPQPRPPKAPKRPWGRQPHHTTTRPRHSSTLNAALRSRRPPSERRVRKGRLARLRVL